MITLDSVTLNFPDKPVFSKFNLDIKEGDKRLICGKSGLGKTTLFKLLLGFHKPDKGRILVAGQSVEPLHIQFIRNQIFYLSQDVDLPAGSVQSFLQSVFSHDLSQDLNFNTWLTFFELEQQILNHDTDELSGGERQRVGLIIGFMLDRPIWLLDEPTSALDNEMKRKTVQKILSTDKTIIIVSHDDVWTEANNLIIERW